MTDHHFDHILNWELKRGSHEFPGPSGGTCINEAAIVAMGFEYKAVTSANDCPPCFSRVFSAHALKVQDGMPDSLRTKLMMPFVMRLGGTADTPEVERLRADYIVIQTIRRILPIYLRLAGLEVNAVACEAVETMLDARAVALEARLAATSARKAPPWRWSVAAVAADAYADADADAAAAAADAAAAAAYVVAAAADAAAWPITASILDGAMKIGRQPDPLDVGLIQTRMDTIRQLSPA